MRRRMVRSRQQVEMAQRLQNRQRVKPGADVVEHDSHSLRRVFQTPERWRLHNVDDTKKYKARQQSFPIERRANERNQLARDFVDDNKTRIFSIRLARNPRGSGDSDE